MALYSLFKLTVLCAFFHETVHGGCCQRSASDDRVAPWEYFRGVPIVLESRTIGCTRNTWMPDKTYNKATEKCELPAAAAPGSDCTGTTTVANAPVGAYASSTTTVTFPKITDLKAVPFTLELKYVNGGQPRDFTGGAFEGSKFSLQGTSPPAGAGAPAYIEWCPNQNYFQVTDNGVTNTLAAAAAAAAAEYFLAGGGESCSTACTNKDDSFPETLSIAGNPAYASQTRGQYTKAAGLEHAGAPVYKRNGWSLYKRSNGKWYLDFNELDDSWAGTVNYASAASDTPFAATWNRDMVVNKDSACDLGAITSAASSVARCKEVVSALGVSFTKSGMYGDDDSGCTYHPGQTGWAQVMNSGRDSGATPAPTCDEINRDQSRRRVCACTKA